MDQTAIDQQLTGLSGLGDPLRRALYRHVPERGVPVSRDDAALPVGISRPPAAHLDGDPPPARYWTPSPDAAASC